MFWKEKTSRSDSDGEKSQVVGAAGLLVCSTVYTSKLQSASDKNKSLSSKTHLHFSYLFFIAM